MTNFRLICLNHVKVVVVTVPPTGFENTCTHVCVRWLRRLYVERRSRTPRFYEETRFCIFFLHFLCICCILCVHFLHFCFAFFVCLIMNLFCMHFFVCFVSLFAFFALCVCAFFEFFVRGGHREENRLVYAMHVYAGYVHMSFVRWRANVHVFSNPGKSSRWCFWSSFISRTNSLPLHPMIVTEFLLPLWGACRVCFFLFLSLLSSGFLRGGHVTHNLFSLPGLAS
jgi:hypothetical protein